MIRDLKQKLARNKLEKKSSWLFVFIGVTILLFALANWQLELKPRLMHEAISNLQILADARAKSIEAELQNIDKSGDLSVIYNSFNEMLLINDALTGEKIFEGIQVEFDFDVYPALSGVQTIQAGSTNCDQCIKTESPIYARKTGELIGIIKIYANPVLYQRLVSDIRIRLMIVLAGVLFVIALAWYLTGRLLIQLKDRESNLIYEISERKQAEEKMQQIATYDQLTNLPNRYLLHSEFKQKLAEAKLYHKKMAVLFIDLDHFKMINDVYGHETGDILLREVAGRISNIIRKYDFLSRFGGDEFVMIMPLLEDQAEVYSVIRKIIHSFNHEYDLGKANVQISTSIGISIFPNDGDTPSKLLKNADLAMYRAKSNGRNGYHFFTSQMNRDLERSQWIEINLKKALKENDLKIYFQPQLDLKTGEIVSCEALLRWPQADGSMISPVEFIPVAERSGLINSVSDWVFDTAYAYRNKWQEKGYKGIRVDINLSGKDFSRKEVIFKIVNLIQQDAEFTQKIGIEITENVLLKSSDEIIDLLKHLHKSKIHISIDDFGTGYSSLNYLKKFPVSCLKIDQTFVKEAPDKEQDQAIMEAFVSVGHGLGMQVIAEGVEEAAHYRLSRNINCDMAQGYFISKPLNAEDFEREFLKSEEMPEAPVNTDKY
jgi:diguanylate cyclase (GGDEF)-like protein